MTELVFGIIGAVVGLGGLVLTYVGNRHQRQQARELDAREARLRSREREAERREAALHASMLLVKVSRHASSLDPSVALWRLKATNDSTQPFTGVVLHYGDQALTTLALNGHLNPGDSVEDALPLAEGEPDPSRCVVDFVDVTGQLWRRRATGDLRRGRRAPDGQVAWDVDAPYALLASRIGEPARPAPPVAMRARPRRSGCLIAWGVPALLLGATGLIIWYLTLR